MGRLTAPFKFLTRIVPAGAAEISETFDPSVSNAFFFAPDLSGLALRFPLVVSDFCFRLSNLARVSVSHAALTPLPREAFLLLCHSAESLSPAICAIV